MRGNCGQTALADLEALSFFAKGNDCADSFMARHERKCGYAPFVIEHGEVGMTYSAVADLNLCFLGSEFTRIEAERLKRGMRLGSSVSMEGGGHLVALLNRELTIKVLRGSLLQACPRGRGIADVKMPSGSKRFFRLCRR